jgi:hypothetical protein
MTTENISRKHLNNEEFLRLRQATEKVAQLLNKRLKNHLEVIKSLFTPRLLLGTFIKSAYMEEVQGMDKAFAELEEGYGRVCEKTFGLTKKLQIPLPPITNQIEITPYQYSLYLEGSKDRPIRIISPTHWVLAYRSECPFHRLRAMAMGLESLQADEIRQSLINHLLLVIFLKYYPALSQLLEDLRYHVEMRELDDLGGLQVVMLRAPVETFLPPDDFILRITQLSGVDAFQEIIDQEAIKRIPDPLQATIGKLTQ